MYYCCCLCSEPPVNNREPVCRQTCVGNSRCTGGCKFTKLLLLLVNFKRHKEREESGMFPRLRRDVVKSFFFPGCPVGDIPSAAQRHLSGPFKLLKQSREKYHMTSLKHLIEIWHTSFKRVDDFSSRPLDTDADFVFKGSDAVKVLLCLRVYLLFKNSSTFFFHKGAGLSWTTIIPMLLFKKPSYLINIEGVSAFNKSIIQSGLQEMFHCSSYLFFFYHLNNKSVIAASWINFFVSIDSLLSSSESHWYKTLNCIGFVGKRCIDEVWLINWNNMQSSTAAVFTWTKFLSIWWKWFRRERQTLTVYMDAEEKSSDNNLCFSSEYNFSGSARCEGSDLLEHTTEEFCSFQLHWWYSVYHSSTPSVNSLFTFMSMEWSSLMS